MPSPVQPCPLNRFTIKVISYNQPDIANWYTQLCNAFAHHGGTPNQTCFKMGSVQVDNVAVVQLQMWQDHALSSQAIQYTLEVEFQQLWDNSGVKVAKKKLSGQDLLDLIPLP